MYLYIFFWFFNITISSVVQFPWLPNKHILSICINKNGHEVANELIQSAANSINIYISSERKDSMYIDIVENEKLCEYTVSIESLVSNESPGYCSRDYVRNDNKYFYNGCNITMNICQLQTAASFYNVLLHEFLHLLGLDHPIIKDDSVMSYTVKKDTLNNIVFDDTYITIQLNDIIDIHIMLVQISGNINVPFPTILTGSVPTYNSYEHVSGVKNRMFLNRYCEIDIKPEEVDCDFLLAYWLQN